MVNYSALTDPSLEPDWTRRFARHAELPCLACLPTGSFCYVVASVAAASVGKMPAQPASTCLLLETVSRHSGSEEGQFSRGQQGSSEGSRSN